MQNPLRLPCKMTSERQKVLRTRQFFTLLTSKCASRHNGMHFFDISTSERAPKLRCFVHFDFEMCFAPQRRANFHLSSGQMWLRTRRFSEPTFWPSGATNHLKKTRCFATFRSFRAPASSFVWLSLLWSSFFFFSSLLWLFPSLLFISPYCPKFELWTSFDQ